MFGWLFRKKKEIDELELVKDATKRSFESVRNDLNNTSHWIKHLKTESEKTDFRLSQVEETLSTIETDLEGLKNSFAFAENAISKRLFKQPVAVSRKQTAVEGVQIGVQTAVQTGGRAIFDGLSVMERAIVHALLVDERKLSYDDLAALMSKSRATIRGQVNSIKQKKEGLIEEVIEANGKKRIYIPQEIRENMLKSGKVRVRKTKEGS